MSYIYIRSEPGLWTVGCTDPNGKWHPESDHPNPDAAAARVAMLNGGTDKAVAELLADRQKRVYELENQLLQLTDPVAVHANMLRGTIAKPSVEQILHIYPELENELILARAEAQGAGSLLLDVQKECIAIRQKASALSATLQETQERLAQDGERQVVDINWVIARLHEITK